MMSAAGALIVEEAVGKVTDFKRGEDFVFGSQIIATNGLIHQKFTEKVKPILKLISEAKYQIKNSNIEIGIPIPKSSAGEFWFESY